MNVWWSRRRKRYSMERLRCLYADLLEHIDVSNEELGPRRAIRLDADGCLPPTNHHHHYHPFPWRHALFWHQHLWSSNKRSIFSLHHQHHDQYDTDNDDINNNSNDNSQSSSLKRRKAELASAFRVLSATKSADKEGDNFGAIAVRDDATVAALALARSIEVKVVALIANIGDVVIQSDHSISHGSSNNNINNSATKLGFLRSDAVFEYFCEKAIFSLLIEIAQEKPTCSSSSSTSVFDNNPNTHLRYSGPTSCFHGVVWSPLVKAQVLQTVSTLVSSVRDMSALFYLLSNNYINELILSMLPTTQWTDPALVKIMPAYVQLLRNMTLHLVGSPTHLFPFMILNRSNCRSTTTKDQTPSFPLLTAALEVAMSSYAQSDSFVHLTCLHVIVNLLQIPPGPVRIWISRHSDVEQKKLAMHLCQRLVDRYHRLVDLCTGPVVDAIRSSSIVGQLTDLSDQLSFLNLLFSCDVLSLSVRVCETLLQRVVSVLLHHMLPKERQFLVVGVMDGDVVPRSEAQAHVSTYVLAQMMSKLEYTPWLRMLAVAIFHPMSPSPQVWRGGSMDGAVSPKSNMVRTNEYILTPALNTVVQAQSETHKVDVVQNPFREQLVKALSRELGQWRFVSVAVLLESALTCDALDTETLASLKILPQLFNDQYRASSLELALGTFLAGDHQRLSAVSAMSLECAGSLALALISQMTYNATHPNDYSLLYKSPVVQGLWKARNYFYAKSLEGASQAGVSEIFIDLVESAILSRFQEVYPNHRNRSHLTVHGRKTYAYYLNRYGCQKAMAPKSGILIRKLKGVSSNDVESARFYLQMALHFRSLCRVVEDLMLSLQRQLQQHWDDDGSMARLAQLDAADDLVLSIGGLNPRPAAGMDLDLRGRMAFGILASSEEKPVLDYDGDHDLSRNGIFRPSSLHLVLVLDPTDILVVQPMNRSEVNRGTVVCSIPLRSVIAFASDCEWLHLAIRNVPDVGSLIKNGNMALRFENVGTCLIVRQYIEQAKKLQRLKLMDQIQALLRIDLSLEFQVEKTTPSLAPIQLDRQLSESQGDEKKEEIPGGNIQGPVVASKDHVTEDQPSIGVIPVLDAVPGSSLISDFLSDSIDEGGNEVSQPSEAMTSSDVDALNQSDEVDIERLLQLDLEENDAMDKVQANPVPLRTQASASEETIAEATPDDDDEQQLTT